MNWVTPIQKGSKAFTALLSSIPSRTKRFYSGISVLYLLLMIISLIALLSCSPGVTSKGEPRLDQKLAKAPKWVFLPESDDGLAAYGYSRITKAGLNFARVEALSNARDELARILKLKVKNMVKNFTEATGIENSEAIDRVSTQVSKQVANESLQGSKQKDMWISPDNELFVLVVIDKHTVSQYIKNSVTTSFKNEDAIWQQVQAKKSYEDLQKEVDKEMDKPAAAQ